MGESNRRPLPFRSPSLPSELPVLKIANLHLLILELQYGTILGGGAGIIFTYPLRTILIFRQFVTLYVMVYVTHKTPIKHFQGQKRSP